MCSWIRVPNIFSSTPLCPLPFFKFGIAGQSPPHYLKASFAGWVLSKQRFHPLSALLRVAVELGSIPNTIASRATRRQSMEQKIVAEKPGPAWMSGIVSSTPLCLLLVFKFGISGKSPQRFLKASYAVWVLSKQPTLPSSFGTAQSGPVSPRMRPWMLSENDCIESNPASIHGPENLRRVAGPCVGHCVEKGRRPLATVVKIPDLFFGPPALGSQL